MTKIAFLGKMYSGKTECAKYLETIGYKILSFAEPMKQDIVELVQKRAPWVDRKYLDEHKAAFRKVLQGYGTETMKSILGDDCWARIACQEAIKYENATVDDMRFLIEALTWRELTGGIVVKLVCPDSVRRKRLESKFGPFTDNEWIEMNNHQSETEVDQITPDYIIHNAGNSIVQLHLVLNDFVWRIENAQTQQIAHLLSEEKGDTETKAHSKDNRLVPSRTLD
jgi:dephospho-CoA kinase